MVMQQTWKVGELAQLTGLTIRTLRYYDKIGLFGPSAHSDSGHRLYTASDLTSLQQILSLKELGLSLDEIRSLIAGKDDHLAEIVALQIARLKEKITAQQMLLRELEHVASLMTSPKPLTVEDFTRLLAAMRTSHERYFAERRANLEQHLDRLGDFLREHQPKGGETHND